VAKELHIPIYYIIDDSASLHEVRLLNQNIRPWTTGDYLHSYISLGYSQYIDLSEFAKTYSFSVPYALLYATGNFMSPQKHIREFRQGKFAFENHEKAENMASFVNELRKHCEGFAWRDRDFLRALSQIFSKIDQKKFLEKLEKNSLSLTRRTSVRDYLRQFEDVLNFRVPVLLQKRLY